jgi:zinc protease
VVAEDVFALAKKYFGPLQPEEVAAPKRRGEPVQRGEKRLRVKAPAKEPYLIIGYKATALGHAGEDWEPYALEMLASVLDGGSSARFSRELVRGTRVAASASAGYSAFTRLPGMLLIDGTPAKGRTVEDLERAFMQQVERVRTQLVEADELERIRTQLIAGKVYERDSVYSQAMQIGRLETVGLGWPLVDQYVEHLSRVTPEQIRSVAQKYLTPDNLTVARLEPLPIGDNQRRPDSGGGQSSAR